MDIKQEENNKQELRDRKNIKTKDKDNNMEDKTGAKVFNMR